MVFRLAGRHRLLGRVRAHPRQLPRHVLAELLLGCLWPTPYFALALSRSYILFLLLFGWAVAIWNVGASLFLGFEDNDAAVVRIRILFNGRGKEEGK